MTKLMITFALIMFIFASCNTEQTETAQTVSTPQVTAKEEIANLADSFELVLEKQIEIPSGETHVQRFYKLHRKDFHYGIGEEFKNQENNNPLFESSFDKGKKEMILKIFKPKSHNLSSTDYVDFVEQQKGIFPYGQGLGIAWLNAREEITKLPKQNDCVSLVGLRSRGNNKMVCILDYAQKNYNQVEGWEMNVWDNRIHLSEPYLVMFQEIPSKPADAVKVSQATVYDPNDPNGEKGQMMEESTALFGAEGNR